MIVSCSLPANPSREFSGSIGNVAWKERVDGWKMKQDKGTIPMTNGTSIAPSEGRGVGDIDASTDYNMEDALLLVPTPSFSSLMFYRIICCLVLMFSLISIGTFTKKGKKA